MDEYEVVITVRGVFYSNMKPQITKDIKIISERLNTTNLELSETVVSVTLESNSSSDAKYFAQKKLNQFLAFFSVMTLDHMKIIVNQDNPIKVTKLTGKRETIEYHDRVFHIGDFNPKILSDKVLPQYPIINNKGNEYVRIAMEHLLRARFEGSVELIILNNIVALESLFSESKDSGEIIYKISNRVATLLGRDNAHRIWLRKEVRDLYKQRSRIVHGDPLELEPDAFGGLFIWTKEAILRFLTLVTKYPDHDTIIHKIDDAMIDNLSLDDLRKESSDLYDVIHPEHERIIHDVLGFGRCPED